MASVTRQLDARSLKFETGAVAGLLQRRKLCLSSANLPKAPQSRRRAVLEMMLNLASDMQYACEPFGDRSVSGE